MIFSEDAFLFAVERDCLAWSGQTELEQPDELSLGDTWLLGIIEVEEGTWSSSKASVSYLPQENATPKVNVQELINFRSIYPQPLTGEEIDDLF